MSRAVALGIDSSTQSTKVLAVDLETGETSTEGRAPHRGLDIQHPHEWWEALIAATRQGFTPDKLAHLARTAPEDQARTEAVSLPHDWLNVRLTGRLATDRGEASGSGWWSPLQERERRDLLALAVGPEKAAALRLPEAVGPHARAGELLPEAAKALGLPAGIPVGPGTGDNMAAALGIGAAPGELVISLGTSGTAFTARERPVADPTGEVAGFADATKRYLPLACMLNCTRVVDTACAMLGLPRSDALERAASIEPGAEGLLLMPYLAGERTPDLPAARGSLIGLGTENATPELLVRAALDGVAAGLAYALDALARLGITADAVTLVGGGSQHAAWRQAIADATGLPVIVRGGGEHAARGAARQAVAIARDEPVDAVARRWRPAVVARVEPRPKFRDTFRLDERRQIIDQLKAATAISRVRRHVATVVPAVPESSFSPAF